MHSINVFERTRKIAKQNCSLKFFASLLVILIAMSFSVVFLAPVAGQTTADRTPDRIVSNEMELRNAVNTAVGPAVIALDNDIALTEQLVIPANKDITLTSTSTSKFFQLIGGDTGRSTLGPAEYPEAVINVKGSGALKIDGIVVTCGNYALAWNKLIRVDVCGTLILYNGEISGNSLGDGVVNSGTFEMYSGKISNNNANDGYGGAVNNRGYGTFRMFGGEISNNTGVGVDNRREYNGLTGGSNNGMFSMSGGVICNNDGGGVQNSAIFSMSGGEISNNVDGSSMQSGGGVSNSGIFNMSDGVISNNQATYGGGVYNYPDGNFSLSENAVISNNKAEVGGGVYNAGTFNRLGGVISGNTATEYSDIYPNDDSPLPTASITASQSPTSSTQTINTGPHIPQTEPFPTSVLVVALILLAVVVPLVLLYNRNRKSAQARL
jgi:hypothetical protein